MTTRLDGADAAARFLLDPDTQDPQTVAALKSSFQAIAQHVDSAEWEVNRRQNFYYLNFLIIIVILNIF
jgi:hypothetical protein